MSYTRKSLDQARRQDRVKKNGSICIRRQRVGSTTRSKRRKPKATSQGQAVRKRFDSWEGHQLEQSWLETMIHKYPLRRTESGKVTVKFVHIMEFALKQTGRNFGQLDKRMKKIVSRQFSEMRGHFEAELNTKVGRYTEKQDLQKLAKTYPLRKDGNGRPIRQIEHITQFALRETGREWSALSRSTQKSISQRLVQLRKSYYTKLTTRPMPKRKRSATKNDGGGTHIAQNSRPL